MYNYGERSEPEKNYNNKIKTTFGPPSPTHQTSTRDPGPPLTNLKVGVRTPGPPSGFAHATLAVHGGCRDPDSSKAPGITIGSYGPLNVHRVTHISAIRTVYLFLCTFHFLCFIWKSYIMI